MPDADFDPFQGLDEEEKAYLNGQKKAFAKQKAVHEAYNASQMGDEERKKAAEEHMRATMAAAGFVPSVPQPGRAATAAPGNISILVAKPETMGHELPSTTEKFAPDWAGLKEIIAKYDGTWIVCRYEFLGNVANILGFFGKDGWQRPEDAEKQKFEVIVKSGRVFKTDPE